MTLMIVPELIIQGLIIALFLGLLLPVAKIIGAILEVILMSIPVLLSMKRDNGVNPDILSEKLKRNITEFFGACLLMMVLMLSFDVSTSGIIEKIALEMALIFAIVIMVLFIISNLYSNKINRDFEK